MACINENSSNNTGCGNGLLIIIVLYILLSIIIGGSIIR